MKRLNIRLSAWIAVFIVSISLFGCQKSESALLSEFKGMTEAVPQWQGLGEAVSFMDLNIAGVSLEGASRMVLAYEDYLLRFLEESPQAVEAANAPAVFLIKRDQSDKGIWTVDYAAILGEYADFISEELSDLLSIKVEEAAAPSSQDSQIKLSYQDLLARALRAETLIKQHTSEDALRANAMEYYEDYLFLLFAGADFSPVFDYATGEFSPEAKEAYEDFIVANPDTVLASSLTEYFAYLNDIKFVIDYSDATENKVFYDTCDYLIRGALQSLE
jgi:hypothetical protein